MYSFHAIDHPKSQNNSTFCALPRTLYTLCERLHCFFSSLLYTLLLDYATTHYFAAWLHLWWIWILGYKLRWKSLKLIDNSASCLLITWKLFSEFPLNIFFQEVLKRLAEDPLLRPVKRPLNKQTWWRGPPRRWQKAPVTVPKEFWFLTFIFWKKSWGFLQRDNALWTSLRRPLKSVLIFLEILHLWRSRRRSDKERLKGHGTSLIKQPHVETSGWITTKVLKGDAWNRVCRKCLNSVLVEGLGRVSIKFPGPYTSQKSSWLP